MDIYNYDKETGEFLGTDRADESPLEPGVFLVPQNATTIKPPEKIPGHARCFVDGKWAQIEDRRGARIYSKRDGSPGVVEELGAIPGGFTDIEPVVDFPTWESGGWVVDAERAATHRFSVNRDQLAESDYKMSRVAEDLVDVLIGKGVITLADLPAEAQATIVDRKFNRAELARSITKG